MTPAAPFLPGHPAKNLLRFILCAWRSGHAYIDMDGCLLEKMPMPSGMPKPDALAYWVANLKPTPIVRQRLWVLYLLKGLGVRLYAWTNRWPAHEAVTRQALGRHARLFSAMYYLAGHKETTPRHGPCMDDDARYVGAVCGDLLVARR